MENQASQQQHEQHADPQVMHSFGEKPQSSTKVSARQVLAVLVIVVLLGVGTGFVVATLTGGTTSTPGLLGTNNLKGKTFGSDDTQVFKDTAEGVMQEGGVDGEGEYHLEREGGESQNVYLTSSLVDLSQFVGVKVKVWGETQTAQKAGWLMDVGRVEVL